MLISFQSGYKTSPNIGTILTGGPKSFNYVYVLYSDQNSDQRLVDTLGLCPRFLTLVSAKKLCKEKVLKVNLEIDIHYAWSAKCFPMKNPTFSLAVDISSHVSRLGKCKDDYNLYKLYPTGKFDSWESWEPRKMHYNGL